MSDAPHPIVKVFGDKGCQSYWIACPTTKQAILVDPKLGRRDAYRKAAAAYGLTPVAVLDTHTHADHLSDSVAFVRDGLTLYMSARTTCRRNHVGVKDGDEIALGHLRLKVIEVPGHTGDSIALYIAGEPGLVVTGDSLLVGALGRTDFRGGDAAQQYESVSKKLLTLPRDTVVLPGHGYRDVLFSTIDVERMKNPALAARSASEYAAKVADVPGKGNTPDVDLMLKLNVEAAPELPEGGQAVVACCDAGGAGAPIPRARENSVRELAERRRDLVERGEWIDVRDPFEFRASRIPGAKNVPLGELGFHLDELRGKPELVTQCLGGVRSMTAARTLQYLGIHADPVSMAGGFEAWQTAGLPVES